MDIGAENSVSLGGNIWQVARADGRVTEVMAQKFDLPLLIAEIMSLRGVDVDDAPSFLEPKINCLMPDPFVLKDMKRAACRIAEAVMKKERIAIIGDYDVDGATSTSVMKLFLQSVGVEPQIHIPDREEGYGPSIKAVDDFKAAGARLLLTLDCGTTAFDSLEYAASLGMDVIVLDHHDADEKRLPNAYAVVNPKRLDEDINHPCHYMAAVGVVFLFSVALNAVLRRKGFYGCTQPTKLYACCRTS